MTELKPCPFCGGKAERKGYRKYKKGYASTVGCTACEFKVEQASLYEIEKAYHHAENAWNRRVDDDIRTK